MNRTASASPARSSRVPAPIRGRSGRSTAGNASGVNDAAVAVVLASAGYADSHGLAPLGRLIACGHAGVEPRIMGIGYLKDQGHLS